MVPYKDKANTAQAMKDYRQRQKGITEQRDNATGITGIGITWYPNKPTDENGQPIKPVMLSDGQKFYPRHPIKGLSPDILADIEREGKRRGDTEARLERALRYRIDAGKPIGKERSFKFDNGSYLAVDKLVSQRKLLTYLAEHMVYPDGLRVGVSGPTIAECKPLLDATA